MNHSTPRLLALVLLVALAAPPAGAFTADTRVTIVQRAASLMPDVVQTQLRRHSKPLFTHALEGVDRIDARGVDALDPGDADARLEQLVDEAVAKIDAQAPMAELAASFGKIARVVADLSFALNVGPDDPREPRIYLDFARFVESRLDRIRITFTGFEDPHLAVGDVRGFARGLASTARRDYEGVLLSYFPEGRDATSADFDDRSVAFAAASLEVSLAVSATARAWLFAWNRAHGDLEGAPLRGEGPLFGDHGRASPKSGERPDREEEQP